MHVIELGPAARSAEQPAKLATIDANCAYKLLSHIPSFTNSYIKSTTLPACSRLRSVGDHQKSFSPADPSALSSATRRPRISRSEASRHPRNCAALPHISFLAFSPLPLHVRWHPKITMSSSRPTSLSRDEKVAISKPVPQAVPTPVRLSTPGELAYDILKRLLC